jgi:hypothetical protein
MIDNLDQLLDEMTTTDGVSVADLNQKSEVLLVFLRYFGCAFCREAISDLAQIQRDLQSRNITLVFVHMAADQATPESFFNRYKLTPIYHISDPTCYFYQEFGLVKVNPSQLLGLRNWIRGFQAGILEGHGFHVNSDDLGDTFQMPGVFFIRNKTVVKAFVHKKPYDRPNYLDLTID